MKIIKSGKNSNMSQFSRSLNCKSCKKAYDSSKKVVNGSLSSNELKQLSNIIVDIWDTMPGSSAPGNYYIDRIKNEYGFKKEFTGDEFDKAWDMAASGFPEENSNTVTVDGQEYTKRDAAVWLKDKLSEYGNTYFFPSKYRAILDKFIDKFGSTYFWQDAISSATYGGAYDIEDDQYFTRDDINEFGERVCDHLNEIYPITFEVSDVYMKTPKLLHLEVTSSYGDEIWAEAKIDMRKIHKLSDLLKYDGPMVDIVSKMRDIIDDLYDSYEKDINSSQNACSIDETKLSSSINTTAQSDYQNLRRSFTNKKKFNDRDSAELRDFLDELENKNVSYSQYDNVRNNGCTVFYDDPNTPIVSAALNVKTLNDKLYDAASRYLKANLYWDLKDIADMLYIDIGKVDDDEYRVQVRAELGYDDMFDLVKSLDPIVQKYDQDAYFDMVEPGISEAYVQITSRVISSTDTITASSEYDQYMTNTLDRKQFSVHYTEIDNSPDADPVDMCRKFKFQVREIHPYDDAEYTWAKGENGIIKYIRNGKEVDRTHYMTADDWEMDNVEWCDYIIRVAMEDLTELNKDVKPRMIHN